MNTDRFTGREYLVNEQYKDATNLQARMQLHERFSVNERGWHPWVFDQFDVGPESSILEVGCGPGKLWLINAQRIPSGWNITLGDLSPGMVEEARQNLKSLRCSTRYERFDVQELPFGEGTYDVVIANHMLYHAPDCAKALKEMSRVLKPAGVLYAATNGKPDGPTLQDWRAKAGVRSEANRSEEENVRHFGLASGLELLHKAFTHVEVRRYEDALHVTEVEPLVEYVQSMAYKLDKAEMSRFRAVVEAEIADKGYLFIAKAAGLFVARK